MKEDSKQLFYRIISQEWSSEQVDFIRKQYDHSDSSLNLSGDELNNLFNRRIARFYLSNGSFENFRLNAQDVMLYRKYSKACMKYELEQDSLLPKIWDNMFDSINSIIEVPIDINNNISVILPSIVNAIFISYCMYKIDDKLSKEYSDDVCLKELLTFFDDPNHQNVNTISEVSIKYGEPKYKPNSCKFVSSKFLYQFLKDFLLYFSTRYGSDPTIDLNFSLKELKTKNSVHRNTCIYNIIIVLINFGILNKELDDKDKHYEFKNKNGRYVSISTDIMLYVFKILYSLQLISKEDMTNLPGNDDKIGYIKNRINKMKDNWSSFTFSFSDIRTGRQETAIELSLDKTKVSTVKLIQEGLSYP